MIPSGPGDVVVSHPSRTPIPDVCDGGRSDTELFSELLLDPSWAGPYCHGSCTCFEVTLELPLASHLMPGPTGQVPLQLLVTEVSSARIPAQVFGIVVRSYTVGVRDLHAIGVRSMKGVHATAVEPEGSFVRLHMVRRSTPSRRYIAGLCCSYGRRTFGPAEKEWEGWNLTCPKLSAH